MIEQLIKRYRETLKERIDQTIRMNGTGHATDWAEYKLRVGVYKGLTDAMHEFNELVRHIEDEDE